jgi:hypothetical protein
MMNINISVIIRFTRTVIGITNKEVTGIRSRLKKIVLHISSHKKTLPIASSSSFIIPNGRETVFVHLSFELQECTLEYKKT